MRRSALLGLLALGAGVAVVVVSARLAHVDWTGLWSKPPEVGRRASVVAFSAAGDVFVRDLDEETTLHVTDGPELDAKPKYAPDGRQIAWLRQIDDSALSLMVANADGSGARVVLAAVPELWYFDWAPDSTHLVASRGNRGGSFVVRADGGGEPRKLARGYAEARWLPGSDGFIVSDDTDWHGRLLYLSADERVTRELVAETRELYAGPIWSVAPDGRHLAYTTDEGLEVMELPGGHRRVAPHDGSGWGQMMFSADGTLLAARHTPDGDEPELVVWRVDDFGRQPVARIPIPPGAVDMSWALAPDGTRILGLTWDASEAWLATIESGQFVEIPWPEGSSTEPSWRP